MLYQRSLYHVLMSLAQFYFITGINSLKCRYQLKQIPSENEPFFIIKEKHDFFVANISKKHEKLYIIYEEEQNLIITCATTKLTTGMLFEEMISLYCSSGGNVIGPTTNAEELTCENKAHFSIKLSGKCSEKLGTYFEIGAYIFLKNQKLRLLNRIWNFIPSVLNYDKVYRWLKIYSVCFIIEEMNPAYTIHTVHPISEFLTSEKDRIIESNTIDEHNICPDFGPHMTYYDINYIDNLINQTLGESNQEKYRKLETTIEAARLVPEEDLQYASWRHSAYFSMNFVPLWTKTEEIRKSIENQIREVATKTNKNLLVYTGVNGIMKIRDQYGEDRGFVLNKEEFKIWVPEQFWKIIYDEKSKQAISVIIVNDPFIDEIDETFKLACPACICKENHWKGNNEFRNGFTYCCEAHLFKQYQKFPDFEILGILQGPYEN